MTPEDVARLEEEERQRKVAAGINVAQSGRTPRQVAIGLKLARQYGVAPALVESDPKPFEELDKRDQADAMIDAHPWMAPNFIENPDTAAMLETKDFSKLGNISSALGMGKPKTDYSTFGNVGKPLNVDKLPRLGPPPKPVSFRDLMVTSARKTLGMMLPALGAAEFIAPKVDEAVKDYQTSKLTNAEYAARAGELVGKGAYLGVIDVAHGALGVTEAITANTLGRAVGEDPFFDWYRHQDEIAAATEKLYTPEWAKSNFQAGAFSGVRSLSSMLTMAPLGAGRVLYGLTAMTGGLSFGKYRNRGADVTSSTLGAMADAAIEYGTERLGGFNYIANKTFLHPNLHSFGEYLFKDVLGEQLATLGQDYVDYLVPGSDTKNWKQYWDQRPDAAWQTLWATLVMGTAVGATGGARNAFRRTVVDNQDAVEGLHGQAILGEIMKNAETAPMREANKEEFARFVDAGAANSPVKNVFVPVEAIDKALADETIPEEEKAALTVYQSQIEEARVNNGDVVIPIGEAAANLAGTKIWEKVRDDARVLSGGISGREARENMDKLIDDLEKVGDQAINEVKDAQPKLDAKSAVYNEVKAQVTKAGRSEREAQTTAALIASRAETLATDRYGQFKDAGEAWKWMQLQIRGPEAKPKGGRRVAQTIKLGGRADQPAFELGSPNPLNERERVIEGGGITVTPTARGWRISDLRALERGGGRRALTAAVQEADRLGVPLELSAVPLESLAGKKMSRKALADWYRQFGFTGSADNMVREPQAQSFQQSSLSPLEQVAAATGALEVAKSKKFPTIRDFKIQLQDMVKATKVGNLRDPGRLTRLFLADARLALQNNANAVGWYDEKVQTAMEVFGTIHPEINTDEDARFAFIYALAVTSNGLKVNRNFQLADIAYREYRKTGRMPIVGEGTASKAMQNSLALFNRFKDEMGLPELREFMTGEHTVSEIQKRLGVNVAGEHAGTKVKGAAFLGPKIGNGFFSNLYGDFSQLTMDRWFIRTWGRYTGTLVNVDQKAVKRHTDRVREMLHDLSTAQRKELENILSSKKTPFKLKLGDIEGFAKRLHNATTSAEVRERLNAINPQLRLSAKALVAAADGQKEAPQGPAERNEIRAIMGPVLSELQRDNPELTMADLQAVLWYPEKTLYDTAKAKAGAEAKTGYENEEAPDYANAAVALARSEGIDEEKISAAIARARGRVSAARRAKRAGRSAGADRAREPIQIPQDEDGFPLEDVLVSQGDGQQDPTVYHQFGGQLGAQEDIRTKTALIQAIELEDQLTSEELWALTGWTRGVDGQWRFEIDDSAAQLASLPSSEPSPYSQVFASDFLMADPNNFGMYFEGQRLREVMRHPKLYKFYPKLANLPVYVLDMDAKMKGFFDGRKIVLNAKDSATEQLSTILHETQHAIQWIEGFANGATADPEALRSIGLYPQYEAELAYFRAINRGEVPNKKFTREMSDGQLRASAAFAIYERVAGEVEARNTQFRASMTAEQRRQFHPDLSADFNREDILLPQEEMAIAAQSTTGPTTPRGETRFYPDGKTIVQLFKADFSTMLHEMSHVFLEQEFRLAQMDGASDELKGDVDRLRKWFKDHNADFEGSAEEKAAAHELFARTGERYFREGKAPSAELRSVFKQFREWMVGVYKNVKDLLVFGPAPINPEIREVFDRMIATQDAINYNSTEPMSQEELGMTSAEYEAYLAANNTARDAAYDTLLDKMMRSIRRREEKRMRAQRANVRDDVAEEVNSDPKFVALHLLRTGRWLNDPGRERVDIKINTGWLIDNYGDEILDQLPVGLQKLHRGDGVDGDTIAEMVGLPSGDALVKALVELKQQADLMKSQGNPRPLRDQIIEDRTDQIMAERHGDVMTDKDIEEEAIAALNSNRQGEVLATELRQLMKKSAAPGVVTPYQILREWARRKANEGTVAEAASKETLRRYIRAFNKARTAFENALLKGDGDEAVKQKRAQLINHALLAEGKKVADEIDSIVRRMQRYAKTKTLASIDQDYMDRIHELLEGYNFRIVSDVARQEKASFEEWAAKQREAGNEVYVPPRFRDDRTNWKDAQVAKLLELSDMVSSLVSLGRLKQKMIVAGEERRLDDMRDEAEASVLALPERKVGDTSTGETLKPLRQRIQEAKTFADYRSAIVDLFRPGQRIRQAAAGLVKIEGLADILDQTKMGIGVFNRVLIRGATDAANTYSQLKEEVMDVIAAAYRGMDGKMAARLNNLVTIPELTLNAGLHENDPRLGQPLNITRKQLIALVANTGNLSNLSKLVGGERWGDPDSMVDMIRVQQTLIGYLNKEEMDFVNALWEGMSKLWPHIVRVEREMTGVVPEAVTPMDVETPWGTYRGGYWPVVWDSDRTNLGKPDEEKSEENMFGVGSGLGTYKGHTITRTGAMGPMDWSLERVLFARTNQVISRIAYAPWIRESLKLLNTPRVSGAIRLRLGNEYLDATKRWMRDQIPSNMQDVAGAKFWENLLTSMRVNMTATVLGISYSTGIAQALGLSYSAGVLGEGNVAAGPKWLAAGFQRMIQLQLPGQAGAQEFVFSRSEEMRRRAHELNREVIDVFRRLDRGGGNKAQRVQRWLQAKAFWHIAFIDLNSVSIPTWLGGYEKAKAQGLSEDDAAAFADKAVRLSQGSGREKDMSAIQRGNAGQRFISMFYTPSSVFFNQQWEAAQHMKAGNWSKALAPTFWFLIVNTLLDAYRTDDWPPEDEEGNVTPESIAKWVSRNLFFGMFYGVPVARDIATTANRKIRGQYADWGSTPLSYGLQSIGKGIAAGYKGYQGEDLEGHDIKNMATALGFVLGLPGGQAGKTAGFLEDVRSGKVQPESVGDWFKGLTSGKVKQEQE